MLLKHNISVTIEIETKIENYFLYFSAVFIRPYSLNQSFRKVNNKILKKVSKMATETDNLFDFQEEI